MIRGRAGQGTEVFDAKGMTVVPGFIDCHNHAGGKVLLNLDSSTSFAVKPIRRGTTSAEFLG